MHAPNRQQATISSHNSRPLESVGVNNSSGSFLFLFFFSRQPQQQEQVSQSQGRQQQRYSSFFSFTVIRGSCQGQQQQRHFSFIYSCQTLGAVVRVGNNVWQFYSFRTNPRKQFSPKGRYCPLLPVSKAGK